MKPLNPKAIWRGFAQAVPAVRIGFAIGSSGRHCFFAGQSTQRCGLSSNACTPHPSLRSGSSQAGPVLTGTFPQPIGAGCVKSARIYFESRRIAVESVAITTNQRGSSKCASRLSSLPFSPSRSPVACRTRRRAALLVPLRALPSQMRWMKTWLPVQPSARLPVQPPAGSSWACRPAALPTELTACGRAEPHSRTIRASRPGGPFSFCALGGR